MATSTVSFVASLTPLQESQTISEYLSVVSTATGAPVSDLEGTISINTDGTYTLDVRTKQGKAAVYPSDGALAAINSLLPSTLSDSGLPVVTQSTTADVIPSTHCCAVLRCSTLSLVALVLVPLLLLLLPLAQSVLRLRLLLNTAPPVLQVRQ